MATPAFAVSEEKNRWLREKMTELGVAESDLEERFVPFLRRRGAACEQDRHLCPDQASAHWH